MTEPDYIEYIECGGVDVSADEDGGITIEWIDGPQGEGQRRALLMLGFQEPPHNFYSLIRADGTGTGAIPIEGNDFREVIRAIGENQGHRND